MATPKLSLVKTDVHHLGKKPLPESALKELKIEIVNLIKEEKGSRYEQGKKLDLLQKERARGRTGTFMKDLREMHIDYSKANRLIKFYRRVVAFVAVRKAEGKTLDAKWKNRDGTGGIEDLNDLELALDSKNADERLAGINVLAAVERLKVQQAQASRAKQPPSYKVTLAFSDTQKERFKKAWASLEEDERTSVVFKAITDAAKKNS
jgi:hypothetical protein